jgi:hypothetical protein
MRLPASEKELDRGGSPFPSWQKILLAALRARSMRSIAAPARDRTRIGRGLGGFLRRLVLVAVLLFLAMASGLFLFGQTLLRF